MTWPQFTEWLNQRFAAVFSWLKREAANLDSINDGLRRIERDQQLFFTQLFSKVDNMANDLDAVTNELTADTSAMSLAASAIDALLAANEALKTSGAGDAAAHELAIGAAAKATKAREALQTELDKATAPAKTETGTTGAPAAPTT